MKTTKKGEGDRGKLWGKGHKKRGRIALKWLNVGVYKGKGYTQRKENGGGLCRKVRRKKRKMQKQRSLKVDHPR